MRLEQEAYESIVNNLTADGSGVASILSNFTYTAFASNFNTAASQEALTGVTESQEFNKSQSGNSVIVINSNASETVHFYGRLGNAGSLVKIADIVLTAGVNAYVSTAVFPIVQIRNLNNANTYNIYYETIR